MTETKKDEKKSRFYVTKTISEARAKLEDKVNTANEKYIEKPIKKSREFISELKADPVKTIEDLIDDGREAIEREANTRMDSLKEKVETRKTKMRERMDKINKETRKVYEGIEKDARLVVDDMIDAGKKQLDRIPGKQKVEKKLSATLNAIPSKLNLPSKEEIEGLVAGIDGVSKKVDDLNRDFSKA
jgi:polyhydroxyalkanoate synthesis regulator phasin